ncbi:hypothetical protein BRE01_45970 [Brevibacillus reuszeri]|uniref:ABC transmembrane type-1 domain-containing protein n=1 Tax=Brevibacillus reuszeri TaxID=54915 RepID=A0ABQ0TT02_9BACL|nr:ABC transporter ATP-binding protein [Brevibacillus reuszeri]MED1861568.1 ABC transporter ATP-binding protein [Brevibacillus reuszeri]GED70895.1 hypothetical protein BRE01_45970 [Brevibacillus reuszeri]
MKASRLSASFPPIIEWINYIGMTLVLLFGAWQAMQNQMTVGDIVAYLAYLRLLQGPIRSFSRMVSKIQQASAAYERIHEVLETVPVVRNKKRAINLPPLQGDVLFDNVDFAYEKGVPVLQNFYLRIEPKQVTALVGSSGSGKSTIAHLIARLYDVQKGAVFVDGYPLTDVTLESLRTQIGIVSALLIHRETPVETVVAGK